MEPAAAMMLSRALPILLLLAVTVSAERAPTLVFILAGQSNMGGRGGATVGNHWDGVVPPECAPSPRTLRLSPSLRWEEAREPLHAGVDVGDVVGVGPGMPFAHALLRSPACPRGAVVPPIVNWTRGSEMYSRLVTRARVAGAGTGRIAALLWFQGKADDMRPRGRAGLRREDGGVCPGRSPGPRHAQPPRHPGWDRDGAESGEVAGPGAEAAEGGADAEPQVRGRHGSPPCQRHHTPHHPGAGPARQDARRRLHRHALMT
uniref:Sialate O-acetylesterase domain-containing protein n=1 Tax=Triticum urartu TaxID=4572 RepID=A0A8R7QWX9_TRIUA